MATQKKQNNVKCTVHFFDKEPLTVAVHRTSGLIKELNKNGEKWVKIESWDIEIGVKFPDIYPTFLSNR